MDQRPSVRPIDVCAETPLSGYTFSPGSAAAISQDGVWFKDECKRYCLFRGVNLSSKSKLSPYFPFDLPTITMLQGAYATPPTPFTDCRATKIVELLKKVGFNIIRLVVPWKAVVGPLPGDGLKLDYLAPLKAIIDYLYCNGMFVVIDFHQDIAHELYGGDGFPDWAIAVDEDHPSPSTRETLGRKWGLRYYQDGGVRQTLKSFWNNETTNTCVPITAFPTQQTFVKTLGLIADFFRQSGPTRQAILGYEPFNEPHEVGMDKRDFEENLLTPFYLSAYEMIHTLDPQAFIFVEPRVDWNTFSADGLELPWGLQLPVDLKNPNLIRTFVWKDKTCSDPPSKSSAGPFPKSQLVFSFHFYDPWTTFYDLWPNVLGVDLAHGDNMVNKKDEWPRVFDRMIGAALERKLIPFMTEFGVDQHWNAFGSNIARYPNQTVAYLDLLFQQIEATLLNAMQWVCEPYYDDTSGGGDGWNGEKLSILDGNGELWEELRTIIPRPYPMRSPALPTLLRFDSASSQAILELTGTPTPAPAVIYIPKDFHYPNGFEVRATCNNPQSDLRWDETNYLLYWNPKPDDSEHYVIICKPSQLDAVALPDNFQTLGGRAPVIYGGS